MHELGGGEATLRGKQYLHSNVYNRKLFTFQCLRYFNFETSPSCFHGIL